MTDERTQAIFNVIQQQQKTPLEQLASLRQAQDQLGLQGIEEQRQGIAETKAQLAQLKENQPDLRKQQITQALLAAGDLLSGSNGQASRLYQMFQPKDNTPQQTKLQQLLAQQQNNLSRAELGLVDQQIMSQFRDAQLDLQKYSVDQRSRIADLKEQLKKDKGEKGKTITAAEVSNLADLEDQLGSIDNLYSDWQNTIGGVEGTTDYLSNTMAGYFPNTKTSAYKDNLKQKAQLIGKALEGGKLTDVDYEKYIHFLPQPGDTEARAKSRIANLKEALANKYNNRIDTFKTAGYDTTNFKHINSGTGAAPKGDKGKSRYEELKAKYGY